jgi:hypothetical protein
LVSLSMTALAVRRWVGGLSPAATGFASASARRLIDAWTLQRLLDTVELAGFSLELGDLGLRDARRA